MQACGAGTLSQQIFDGDGFGFGALADGVEASHFEQLIDESIEPRQFGIHCLVEFAAIMGLRFMQQQRVKVEAKRGDGCFQFMRHTVNKVGLPPIELDFLDGQEGVERDSEEADGECGGAEYEAAP